jgi:ATP-dependent DNA helicase DinG
VVNPGSLAELCSHTLSEQGRLFTAIPGFKVRLPQSDLAQAIASAIEAKSTLVAEAGTGTGKTFAYLLPCLLSKKKVLISTATKTLQDQLYQKDLPTLVRALGLSARIQNLKGRANYICQYRVTLNSEEGQFQTPQCAQEIAHIRSKLSQMKFGDRSELTEISEDSPVWPYVTSTVDNCLGLECPNHETCFLVKARKQAMAADVVVINHHLFFADSRLKEEGFGELLPGVEVVIFDEAHQLAEIATHFHSDRMSTRQFTELTQDLINEWPTLDLANQPLKALHHKAQKLMDELLMSCFKVEERVSWEELKGNKHFMLLFSNWMELLKELLCSFGEEKNLEHPGLMRCKDRLEEFIRISLFFSQEYKNKIRWLERFKQTLVFHATPYTVAESFSQLLKRQIGTYVFTSATLTMANSFDCFLKSLGLVEANTLVLPSPFDYGQQALLYLPRGLPDPKNTSYYELLLERVVPIIEEFSGRCFFLFTSHKALRQVAQMMSTMINFPLLIQGSESKPILLERFRQLGNAVLLGTATFWEGVDVKGEALSCVIIDKLPFSSPVDPVTRGKMAYLKEKGLSGFDELSLPNAVIALKQGVGRLIRDNTDKGVLIIADPRLTSREYGQRILASLPKLPKTRDPRNVLKFIKEIVFDYEVVSN